MSCWLPLRFLFYVLLFFGILPKLTAQQHPVSDLVLERELAKADAYLHANPDSTLILTNKILSQLKTRNRVDSPFGLEVQLLHIEAMTVNRQNELAVKKLLRIKQLSEHKKLWYIHARSCLQLALIYEVSEFKNESRHQLALAKADIDRYGLGKVYPRFAVRMSSWQRIFNNKDSAFFFAHEAIRTAPKYRAMSDEADGYFLISSLLPKIQHEEQLQSALKAKKLYQKIGNIQMNLLMCHNIAYIHLGVKQFSQALLYCDSSETLAKQFYTRSKELPVIWIRASSHQIRSAIYEQMGLLDSALANIKRSYEFELKARDLEGRDKINELEVQYQTQLSRKKIEDQKLAIRLKNSQLQFAFIIVGGVMLSSVGLWIAYRKQRQGKKKLLEQNTLIEQQATQLKTLDAAKSRFFANVSHELRTPLTLLLSPIGTLLNENHLTSKQASLLQLSHRNGRQLEQLVTDILDLGKLELSQMERYEKPTVLGPFFRSHFAQFMSLAQSRNIHYTFDIVGANEIVANLDQPKCRQIINNLLGNAFKFTPAGKSVSATLTLIDTNLHLSVVDTGLGIHADDLPYLFDRYFQTTRPNKPAEGGTGIGLALCNEYVQLFGGKIDVVSKVGHGSTFRVEFPVVILPNAISETVDAGLPITNNLASPTLRNIITDNAGEVGSRPKPTLLVVEDNVDLQAYIRLILSEKYQIITADNGQVAIEQLHRTTNVSLILSDLMMPLMDGHKLLERLKSDDSTRHIPVIMLTARADVRDKLRALRIGVDDYLLKPFDEQELLARIENLLANQVARRQALIGEATTESDSPLMSQADREWLEVFEAHIQLYLADDTLSVPELAIKFAMSESTLLRQLKRLTGLSPIQYIQAVRLEVARQLLERRTVQSVGQVAAKVGYTDARTFTRNFRTRFGKLPSELLGS